MDLEQVELIHPIPDPITNSLTRTVRAKAVADKTNRPNYKLTYHANLDMISIEVVGKQTVLVLGNNVSYVKPSSDGLEVIGLKRVDVVSPVIEQIVSKPEPKPIVEQKQQPAKETSKEHKETVKQPSKQKAKK